MLASPALTISASPRSGPSCCTPARLMLSCALPHRTSSTHFEMSYRVTRPFVLDSTASEQRLGPHPTPIDQAIAATVAW